jgi:hypothetical protein
MRGSTLRWRSQAAADTSPRLLLLTRCPYAHSTWVWDSNSVTVRNRLSSQGFHASVAVGRVAESPEALDSALKEYPESRAFLVGRRTGGVSGTIFATGSSVRREGCSGLLNAEQHFGHRRFSSQILASQPLPRTIGLAAVGSRGPVLVAGRDSFRDSIYIGLSNRRCTVWRSRCRRSHGPSEAPDAST